MKTSTMIAALAIAAVSAGCSTSPLRSRNLADPNVPGRTLAEQVCSNCHRVTGNSVNPTFPKLAQQQKDYIIAQLKGFRAHRRADPPGYEYMWGIARSLTNRQINQLAEYFSSQTSTPLGKANPKLVAAGRKIFEKGLPAKGVPPCSTCHGDHGQGRGHFPRIAYQHSDYVIKQLTVFQRTNERPDGVVMKTITHDLSPRDMKEVAAYLKQMSPM